MIETFDQAEFHNPWSSDGVRIWSYAHLNIHAPWLYVKYEFGPPDERMNSMYLLFHEEQLFELANQDEITISSVYAVTPSYVNKSKTWKMDLLKSLSTGVTSNSAEQKIVRYELTDETEYFYPDVKGKKRFNKLREIYSAAES